MKKYTAILIILSLTSMKLASQDPTHYTNRNLPCIERKFHMYVHVALDSLRETNITTDKIKALIEKANVAFAPICISFDYCKIDTVIDYSFATINDRVEPELLRTRFQKHRRINLYLVDSLMMRSFSHRNGIQTEEYAMIIIPKTGQGLIHELGHTFGLYHTFEQEFGLELVDQSNCKTAGDFICDTPADPGNPENEQCNFYYLLRDSNDDFYKTEIGNYMSHHYCAHCFFTAEQYERMAQNYLSSPIKLW